MSTRGVTVEPGYDRLAEGKGAHGDEWRYRVLSDDGETALVLTVYSGNVNGRLLPEWSRLGGYPKAAFVHLHTAWPTSAETALNEEPEDCKYLGRACWKNRFVTFLADDLWSGANEGAPEPQPDSFWQRLEARLAEWDAAARRDRLKVVPELNAAIKRAREAFSK